MPATRSGCSRAQRNLEALPRRLAAGRVVRLPDGRFLDGRGRPLRRQFGVPGRSRNLCRLGAVSDLHDHDGESFGGTDGRVEERAAGGEAGPLGRTRAAGPGDGVDRRGEQVAATRSSRASSRGPSRSGSCENRTMRKLWIAAAPLLLLLGAPAERPRTFANPINIDYRFMVDLPSRREAADPAIVLFGDDYYLFASKSGGYWHSKDMVEWTFVTPTGLPMEAYAPAVMVLDHTLYYTACNIGLYKSGDPKGDKWELVSQTFSVGDPDLFADEDGRVYLYYGLSYNGAISGMELDPNNQFRPIGEPFLCFRANYARHGWERRGDDNLGAASNNQFQEGPWLEGSWMTKHGGTYYLQYASPGTDSRSNADGVYTATSPRGPFTYSQSSPFSHKPTGFITGAGHSATFADKQGHYWHIATMVISVKHQFEQRLGLFPAGFDADGVLHMNTLFGDYPQVVPKERKDGGGTALSATSFGMGGTKNSLNCHFSSRGRPRCGTELLKLR